MLNLNEFDLNLLVVFQETLKQRRVSSAAKHLNLSQPAVSNALRRLRRALGDDLFVRTPTGMAPTPLAEQLANPIAEALSAIQQSLNRERVFDPDSSSRHFTVAMTDVGEIHFLSTLYAELAHGAPHVSISTVRLDPRTLREDMEAGKVDLAVSYIPYLQGGFYQRSLFRHRYVCMFRSGHALDQPQITRHDFFSAEHAVIQSDVAVESALQRAGVKRVMRLSVPHFAVIPYIVSHSDLVATVPGKLAERAAGPFGLKYVKHPIALPTFQIRIFWHSRFHRDPGNQWLRGLFVKNFGG